MEDFSGYKQVVLPGSEDYWSVHLGDGTEWIVTGGCDYTGWDCRSSMEWEDAK